MKKQIVRYEKISADCGHLFLFYKEEVYNGYPTWLWDEEKLTMAQSLKKYPNKSFIWEPI